MTWVLLIGCVNMDIPKKNAITEDTIMSNAAGMDKYLATLYAYMPYEDFKYLPERGFEENGWLVSFGMEGTGEAISRDGISTSFTKENSSYWNDDDKDKARPFVALRLCNVMIENFEKYRDNYTEVSYNDYLGHAYFIRANVFYAMAKRFGGIPLVTQTISYPGEEGAVLEYPRSSEEDTWNQIAADFDEAARLLSPAIPRRGLANKWVALAYKAEAMNYAGSVAKYNETVGADRLSYVGTRSGNRVMGFEAGRATEISKGYFAQAYQAAKEVIDSNMYSLYMKGWSATDREAQYRNMVTMFTDLTSPESMIIRSYEYPTTQHAIDGFNYPNQFRWGGNPTGGPVSGGTGPTLDFVELFDGLSRNAEGRIKVTTGNNNRTGNYLMFDNPLDLFKDAEPRLRAYVILPNDVFKGTMVEVRTGIYNGTEPIAPLLPNYGYDSAGDASNYTAGALGLPLTISPIWSNQTFVEYDGPGDILRTTNAEGKTMVTASGLSGPFSDNNETTLTGFYLRKWLNEDPAYKSGEGLSDQDFIPMRYADVLLAAAEAAVELAIAGAAPGDALAVATKAIQDIQTRAGANVITNSLTGDNASRDLVRKERRKELAFEHKTKWDLRRWRVLHDDTDPGEGLDGIWGEYRNSDVFSNGSNFRFRGLYPFFSKASGKYFFDDRFQWRALKTYGYSERDYYFEIPGAEVNKSLVIDQQPNRL